MANSVFVFILDGAEGTVSSVYVSASAKEPTNRNARSDKSSFGELVIILLCMVKNWEIGFDEQMVCIYFDAIIKNMFLSIYYTRDF